MKKLFHYMTKVFGISQEVSSLTDKRQKKCPIEVKTVILTVLVGFMMQQPSFNAIFTHLSFRRRAKNMFAKGTKLAKKDAGRAIIEMVDIDELKEINAKVLDKIRRNKTFRNGTIDGLVVAAIDGVELFSSYSKCCEECLERTHKKNGCEQVEYFHKAVVCMTVGSNPHIIMGEEMLHPRDGNKKDEGEQTGGKRLIENLYKRHHHFADVIVADALYLNAPFIEKVTEKGMDVVIRSKDQNRIIMKDALGLIKGMKNAESFKEDKVEARVWDIKGLEMDGVKKPLRLLQFEETRKVNKRVPQKGKNGKKTGKAVTIQRKETIMVWVVTTLENTDAKTIWRIIHKRWDIENNGFRQLKTFQHIDHCFMHGAVENVFLLNILAFNIKEMFLFKRLKSFKASGRTRVDIINELYDDLLIGTFSEFLGCG